MRRPVSKLEMPMGEPEYVTMDMVPLRDLNLILVIESNMFLLMEITLTYFQLIVVYHKVLYWAHYFSLSISMICQVLLRNLPFISLLTIQTSTMNPKIYPI